MGRDTDKQGFQKLVHFIEQKQMSLVNHLSYPPHGCHIMYIAMHSTSVIPIFLKLTVNIVVAAK